MSCLISRVLRYLRSTLVVSCLFTPVVVGAQAIELDFAKGVVAFSRGNLDEAERRFKAVLKKVPEHAQATYYLGQAEFGQGKMSSAVEFFRQAIELSPTNHAIRLDLALALVKTGKFERAEKVLVQASKNLDDRASFFYYLGFCRYRLGRYAEAIEALEEAKRLDQGFSASASYYLGMALYGLGERKRALGEFRRASAAGDEVSVSSLARRNVDVLNAERLATDKRNWGAFASAGGGYDSNVTLDTESRSDARSATMFLSMGGYYRPKLGPSDVLDLSARFFRSFHTTPETRGYDLTAFSSMAGWSHRLAGEHRLGISYSLDLDMLDGPERLGMDDFGVYMHAHTGAARLSLKEGTSAASVITYRFKVALFHSSLDERDHFRHELTLRQNLSLLGRKLRVSARAGLAIEDARHSFYDLWGPLAELSARLEILDFLDLWVEFGYSREKHHNHGRLDNLLRGGGGVNLRLSDSLTLGVGYHYLNNLCDLDEYAYDRHMASLVVMGSI